MTTTSLSRPVTGGDTAAVHAIVLPTPAQCRDQHPLSHAQLDAVASHRQAISSILSGVDERVLAIVGPCSVHSVEQALDYADRLAAVRKQLDDALLVAMRVYIEKPRTTTGWRGLALDPALDESQGPEQGLLESRRVMKGVLDRGLPVATESLDPMIVPYVEDLLAFTSLGARTSESQTHRVMAAAMDCPVGIKNATCGSMGIAADAIVAVASSQTVFNVQPDGRIGYKVVNGNHRTAIVLRGGADGPNYTDRHQMQARQLLQKHNVDAGLIVDCSHGNSKKVAERQKDVVAYISEQIRAGRQHPAGVMIESHINGGKQAHGSLSSLQYGVSITDECLGFEDTVSCLQTLADAVRAKRKATQAVAACAVS